MDETYMGGRRKGGRGRRLAGDNNKSAVLGMVERGGRVKAFTVPDAKSSTLLTHAMEHITPGATVYTDEWGGYNALAQTKSKFVHHRVLHRETYVDGHIHTNSVEGFWGMVKRGITGVYHHVGRNYLQHYINEFAFRYNHRKDGMPMFMLFLRQVAKA
jgi:transposase-like protein